MNDLLNASVRPSDLPSGRKGRHLGKAPILIFLAAFVCVVLGLVYGGIVRLPSDTGSNSAETERESGEALQGDELNEFLKLQPNGFIDSNNKTTTDVGTAQNNENSLPPPLTTANNYNPPNERELSVSEKAYLDYEAKRLNDYVAAINSATKASGYQDLASNGATSSPSQIEALRALAGSSGGQGEYDRQAFLETALGGLQSAIGGQSNTSDDPNGQLRKASFLNSEADPTTYIQSTRTDQITEYEIKTGTVIPGIMISGLNSDLPGQIIAQVRENVYDTATGQHLLIPLGSKLYGTYDSQITYGQNRALAVWTRIIYPDGSTQELGAMAGSDQQGYAGFSDKVNNHYLRTFGSVLLLSTFNALPSVFGSDSEGDSNNSVSSSRSSSRQVTEVIPVTTEQFVGLDEDGEPIIIELTTEQVVTRTVSDSEDDSNSSATSRVSTSDRLTDEFTAQLAQTTAQVAVEVTRKNLSVQPTIKIRPGYKFNVMVNKDIAFKEPYRSFR